MRLRTTNECRGSAKASVYGLFFALAFLGVAQLPAQSGSIRVRALIDGQSRLVARGDSVHWEHIRHAAPGLHQGANRHTDVWMQSAQDPEQYYQWCPDWPNGCNTCQGNCGELRERINSLPMTGLNPPLPLHEDTTWTLETIAGRNQVRLVQTPDKANDFTLIVELDDNGPGGSALYDVRVRYSSTRPSAFGTGCPSSAGVPMLAAAPGSLPLLDETFTVQLTSLPTSAFHQTVGIVGLSRTSWAGISLPHDLGGIGIPGCTQYVSMDASVPLPPDTGTSMWNIPIPNDQSLKGLEFFLQGAVIDFDQLVNLPGGPIEVSVTNALQGVIRSSAGG